MITYETGKTFSILGFVGLALLQVLNFILHLFGMPYVLMNLVTLANIGAFLVVVGSFVIKFLTRRNVMDLAIALLVGLALVLDIIFMRGGSNVMWMIWSALSSLYILPMIWKAKTSENMMLCMLLAGAFLYGVFGYALIRLVFFGWLQWYNLFTSFLICAAGAVSYGISALFCINDTDA